MVVKLTASITNITTLPFLLISATLHLYCHQESLAQDLEHDHREKDVCVVFTHAHTRYRIVFGVKTQHVRVVTTLAGPETTRTTGTTSSRKAPHTHVSTHFSCQAISTVLHMGTATSLWACRCVKRKRSRAHTPDDGWTEPRHSQGEDKTRPPNWK